MFFNKKIMCNLSVATEAQIIFKCLIILFSNI